jgi:hypothetical protein
VTVRRVCTLVLVSGGVLALAVALLVLVRPASRGPAGEATAPRTAGTTEAEALRLLRSWDRERAVAYATGSASRLRALYVPGAAVGVADLRVLHGWSRRGLRVSGMRTQVLALSVLDASPDRMTLRLTDRLTGAVARGGGVPVLLPRDRPSTRELTLVRGQGRWRVAAVRDVPDLGRHGAG